MPAPDNDFNLTTDMEPSTEGDQETLSEAEIVRILFNRMPDLFVAGKQTFTPGEPGQNGEGFGTASTTTSASKMFVRKLASMIPENMRTRDVLERGDLRALLAPLATTPAQAGAGGDTSTVGGVEFTTTERLAATQQLVEITDELRGSLEQQYEKNTEGLTEDEKSLLDENIEDMLYNYRDGVMKEAPSLPDAQLYFDTSTSTIKVIGEVEDGGSDALADQGVDLLNLEGGVNAGATEAHFTQEELDRIFEIGVDPQQSLETVLQREDALANADPSISVTGSEARVNYREPGRVTSRVPHAPGLSLNQVLQKPSGMNAQQLSALSKKMKDAGLYEAVGGEPLTVGDWTDPQFKKAYRNLVALSLQKKIPMMDLLEERKNVYGDAVQDALNTRLTDPARLRMSADNLSRGLLGRTLKDGEHQQIIEFTHELERRNALIDAGLDPNFDDPSVEDLDEGVVADIDARMSDFIRENNVDEFSGERVQDQYDAFSGFLAGPGRGGSF